MVPLGTIRKASFKTSSYSLQRIKTEYNGYLLDAKILVLIKANLK